MLMIRVMLHRCLFVGNTEENTYAQRQLRTFGDVLCLHLDTEFVSINVGVRDVYLVATLLKNV